MPDSPSGALAPADAERLHILVLTDRDWTHPQGGGTGTNLFGQVSRWLAWGHRVTVLAGSYPGAKREERIGNLTIHRMGGRVTVFPRASWRQWRGLVPDADVVLEVFNGISFLTPVWLRSPRVTLVHHIHRGHYEAELGRKGRVAAFTLETLPLRMLYRRTRFLTVSKSSAEDLEEHGIASKLIEVNYNGVECGAFGPGTKAPSPRLVYLGRLKRYKRLEWLLDVVDGVPGAVLDIAGDGDHRGELEDAITARGLGNRVRVLGHVDEQRKRRLLQRAWIHVTASSAEGWSLSVMEAAACGTPTVAARAGGLRESVIEGQTGLLADDPQQMIEATRRLLEDQELRERLSRQALARARQLTWERCARAALQVMVDERNRADAEVRSPSSASLAGAGRATVAGTTAAAPVFALGMGVVPAIVWVAAAASVFSAARVIHSAAR